MPKGYKSQTEGAPTGQIRGKLSTEIKYYSILIKIIIYEFRVIQINKQMGKNAKFLLTVERQLINYRKNDRIRKSPFGNHPSID